MSLLLRHWNHGALPSWPSPLCCQNLVSCRSLPNKKALLLYIRQDYAPALVLTLLEFVYNKSCPSILLHVKDATNRKILILLLQEIKRDIINRLAQLATPPCCREELYPRSRLICCLLSRKFAPSLNISVRYHCGGWPEEVNTCFLNSYMVYL
jgi:hypothetical protein